MDDGAAHGGDTVRVMEAAVVSTAGSDLALNTFRTWLFVAQSWPNWRTLL